MLFPNISEMYLNNRSDEPQPGLSLKKALHNNGVSTAGKAASGHYDVCLVGAVNASGFEGSVGGGFTF